MTKLGIIRSGGQTMALNRFLCNLYELYAFIRTREGLIYILMVFACSAQFSNIYFLTKSKIRPKRQNVGAVRTVLIQMGAYHYFC